MSLSDEDNLILASGSAKKSARFVVTVSGCLYVS